MVLVQQLFLRRISPRGEMKDDSPGVVVGGICAFSENDNHGAWALSGSEVLAAIDVIELPASRQLSTV